ncbi:MAG: ABC transporter transmembrane domain-containing protein [Lachnospirales bacterium]
MKLNKYLLFYIPCTLCTVYAAIKIQYARSSLIESAIAGDFSFSKSAILFVLFIGLQIVTLYLTKDVEEKYTLNKSLKLRKNYISKLLKAKSRVSDSEKSEIINSVTQQIDLLKNNYYRKITTLIYLFSKSFFIFICLLNINIYIASFVLIMLLNQMILPKIIGKILTSKNENWINNLEKLTNSLDELFTNYSLIFNFSITGNITNKIFGNMEKLNYHEYKNFKIVYDKLKVP